MPSSPMTATQRAALIAAGFFTIWIGLLLMGADRPPPVGFLWLVPLMAMASWVVYLRALTYIQWAQMGLPSRQIRVVRDGMAMGMVVATIPHLLPGAGQPGVQPTVKDRIIWCTILIAISVANALLIDLFCAITNPRRRAAPNAPRLKTADAAGAQGRKQRG